MRKSGKVVETLTRRCIYLLYARGDMERCYRIRLQVKVKESIYRFCWVGNSAGTGGVGILLIGKWIEKVRNVNRVSDRIIVIKLVVRQNVVPVVSVYVPQCGLDDSIKDKLYVELLHVVLNPW